MLLDILLHGFNKYKENNKEILVHAINFICTRGFRRPLTDH